jgi:hypothetical protein
MVRRLDTESELFVPLRTGKAGPLLKPRNSSVAFSANRTKPPAISFTTSGRQAGVSCIIKRLVTGVNPNLSAL